MPNTSSPDHVVTFLHPWEYRFLKASGMLPRHYQITKRIPITGDYLVMTTASTFPQKVTACYVTSDQKLHTSAEAADVHQAKLNQQAAAAAAEAEAERKKALIMGPLRSACNDYRHYAYARFRDNEVIRPEALLSALTANGLKLVRTDGAS